MKYTLIIAEDTSLPPLEPAAWESLMDEYRTFTREIVESGEMVGGQALQSPDTATSVRVRNGKPTLTDGPFAETTEQIGGYYVVDVKDLDRALELAAKIPSARTGVIEVRPVADVS